MPLFDFTATPDAKRCTNTYQVSCPLWSLGQIRRRIVDLGVTIAGEEVATTIMQYLVNRGTAYDPRTRRSIGASFV